MGRGEGESALFESKIIRIHKDFTMFRPILYTSQGRYIERSKMKKRIVISSLIIVALFASTSVAQADAWSDYKLAMQQYKTAVANWNLANKTNQDNFQSAMQSWNTAAKAGGLAREEIASNFKRDAEAIKARTAAAVLAATNAKDKKAALTAGKSEMDGVITTRNAALSAIVKPGPKPIKPTPAPSPTPPVKPEVVKKNPAAAKSPNAQ